MAIINQRDNSIPRRALIDDTRLTKTTTVLTALQSEKATNIIASSVLAGEAIDADTFVYNDNGTIFIATTATNKPASGYLTQDATIGSVVQMVVFGEIIVGTAPSGKYLFLNAGSYSIAPSATGFVQGVGEVLTSQKILVDIGQPRYYE